VLKKIQKMKSLLVLPFFLLFYVNLAYCETYFVDKKGSNSNYGSRNDPWATVEHALKKVQYGDTISINDGIYTENQLIVPEGVSLTSSAQDNSKVKIQPGYEMGQSTPFLKLVSGSLSSNGNQTISYIELNGINGFNTAQVAILVQNRNNIRIHHCNIHDFIGTREELEFTIKIESTQIARTNEWWEYWPADPQGKGINNNINALWPKNPVVNFQFDNNTVTNCFAISPFNLKDSKFYKNIIDNRKTNGWTFKAVCAFLDNVDIHDNTLFGAVPRESGQTQWRVELWLHKNGCEYFNNKMNGYYSITYGKETSIYNNTIKLDPMDHQGGTGIEFNGQSFGQIFENHIEGAYFGIRVGTDATCNKKDWIVENIVVRGNTIYNHKSSAIWIQAEGANLGKQHATVRNVEVYGNIIDGQTSEERGDISYRGQYGIRIYQRNNVGTSTLSNVFVKNNTIIDINGYAGHTLGVVKDVVVDSNHFFGNKYNSWFGGIATNTETSEPTVDGTMLPRLLSAPSLKILDS